MKIMKAKASFFRNSSRALLFAAVLFPVAATRLAAAGFESNLDKTFPAVAGGRLVVQADQGSVEVKPVESDKVQIHVLREVQGGNKAQADELFANHEVTFQQDGGTVSVVAKRKRNLSLSSSWWRGQPQLEVRYEISIPKKFDVDLKTSGGDVRVGELDGAVKARTSSGAIGLKGATGKVDAGNSGGDITIAEMGGDLVAQTSSGAINVQKVGGDAQVSNSGGDIRIGEAGQALVART